MKLILAIFLSCLAGYSFSQENGQNKISDSGKIEFNKQTTAEKPDYSTAYRVLKNQLKQYPNNAELHYFFGYTIDRMNAFDGSTMFELKKEKTLEASAHFETVNKLEPVYKGEIVILDPYAKLSSIWGSLAQAYLFRKLKDSAAWAFKEGKKRGAFIEPVLEYNRQMLNSCTKNAILVTSGDNITIPAWYLQEAENYRTDITIVDANLINTSWYTKYLKNDRNLSISFSNEEIDSIDYIEFKPSYITISNPNNSNEKFTWELRPTYLNNYILKGDRILLNILKENLFSRDIYFSFNSDSTWNLFLENYFMEDGLVNKVLKKGAELNAVADSVSVNLKNYTIDKLSTAEIAKSKDAIQLLNTYRWMYYTNIVRLLNNKQKRKAGKLKDEMLVKFPEEKLPYMSNAQKAYFDKLFEEFE